MFPVRFLTVLGIPMKKYLIFFLLLNEVKNQEPSYKYKCTRLVVEKERCEIFNFTHPLCKKWDKSRCPPPRIVRERSHCVSFTCTRLPGWDDAQSDLPSVPSQPQPDLLSEDPRGVVVKDSQGAVVDDTREDEKLKKTTAAVHQEIDKLRNKSVRQEQTLRRELHKVQQKVTSHENTFNRFQEDLDSLENDLKNLSSDLFDPNLDIRLQRLEQGKAELQENLQKLRDDLRKAEATTSERIHEVELDIIQLNNIVDTLQVFKNLAVARQLFFFVSKR